MCLEAVSNNGLALHFIKNQTYEMCIKAVSNNGLAIQYVRDKTKKLYFTAIKQFGEAIDLISDPTPEMYYVVLKNPSNMFYKFRDTKKYFESLSVKMLMKLISVYYPAFKYIKKEDLTDEYCSDAIKINPKVIEYIKDPSYDLCLLAVRINGLVLEYIEYQTVDLCMEAIKNNPEAFQYVKKQTYELCLFAVQKYGHNIKYVKQQSFKICMAAIQQNGNCIYDIVNPCEKMIISAILKASHMPENPTTKMLKIQQKVFLKNFKEQFVKILEFVLFIVVAIFRRLFFFFIICSILYFHLMFCVLSFYGYILFNKFIFSGFRFKPHTKFFSSVFLSVFLPSFFIERL
jgi:hypothetical protein